MGLGGRVLGRGKMLRLLLVTDSGISDHRDDLIKVKEISKMMLFSEYYRNCSFENVY